jgi:hypothetical protein
MKPKTEAPLLSPFQPAFITNDFIPAPTFSNKQRDKTS